MQQSIDISTEHSIHLMGHAPLRNVLHFKVLHPAKVSQSKTCSNVPGVRGPDWNQELSTVSTCPRTDAQRSRAAHALRHADEDFCGFMSQTALSKSF